ncbi:MAG TPA: nucleoside phosphorylase [Puia sp.]|nr:nucleoside phosphorylase [Puia sp.]
MPNGSTEMQRIEESELIINSRGAIYHLDLRPDELSHKIFLVGDPGRVSVVSKYFDRIEIKQQHREFVSHTGFIGQDRYSVISTGIGTDNIDIVMNELDALVNIDFNTRTIKPNLTQLQIIRLGTSGSLQKEIPVDSFVASTHGLGIDNLLNFYRLEPRGAEQEILQAFTTHTQLHQQFAQPAIASASGFLLKHFTNGYHTGITITCPGFYGPQGRILRLGLKHPDLIERLTSFSFGPYRITNFEMETSAIYGLGTMLGHQCLSLNVIVANRITKTFSGNGLLAVERLIEKSIETIRSITH